jgi:hypothetical protein
VDADAEAISSGAGPGAMSGAWTAGLRAGRGAALEGGGGASARRAGVRASEFCRGGGSFVAQEESKPAPRAKRMAPKSNRGGTLPSGRIPIRPARGTPRRSTARQTLDRAEVTVAVDGQQLVVIQQHVSLVSAIAIKLGYRVALLDQFIRQSLSEVGLPGYETGEGLPALRPVCKPEHPAAGGLIEHRALAVGLVLNNGIRADRDAGALGSDPVSDKRVFAA